MILDDPFLMHCIPPFIWGPLESKSEKMFAGSGKNHKHKTNKVKASIKTKIKRRKR